jgi:PBSX family phage portal protein
LLRAEQSPGGVCGGEPGAVIRQRVAKVAEQAHALLKAVVIGGDVQDPASLPGGEEPDFAAAGAIAPPYDPAALCLLFEHSNALRQNVDAYATNIDAFGHRLEAAVDLEADDASQRVADTILLERLTARDRGRLPQGAPLEPTPEEIAQRRTELAQLARIEKARLETFFEFACFDHSFVELRKKTRQDLEVTGNAYWEVLRDGAGRVARLVYVPSFTVRLLRLDRDPVEILERRRVSPVTFETAPARMRVRRFLQIQDHARIYFKALGDPRVVSKLTGAVHASVEALNQARATDAPATEMIHFNVHSPRSPYGVPRWIGTLLSVLGSRESEEVNYLYFSNKSVPPLALLVSGGRLSEASIPRIERYVEEHIKGKQNFHKILILEAEGGAHAAANDQARARIELRPLTEAQQQDALFQAYDQRNMDKVGAAFRLPRLLRGEGTDFNRSVADAQLRFAEDQVFQPERDQFDFFLNRRLLADMGIRFWRFRSQTPLARDPERLTDMVEKLMRVGVLIPEEGRMLAGDIFNREFRRINQDWVKRPLTLTLAGIQTGVEDLKEKRASLLDDARRLINLRSQLEAEEERLAKERLDLARRYEAGEAERIEVPSEEFAQWFAKEPA